MRYVGNNPRAQAYRKAQDLFSKARPTLVDMILPGKPIINLEPCELGEVEIYYAILPEKVLDDDPEEIRNTKHTPSHRSEREKIRQTEMA